MRFYNHQNIIPLTYEGELLYVVAMSVPEGSHSYRFKKNWANKHFWYTDSEDKGFYYCYGFNNLAEIIGEVNNGAIDFELAKPNNESMLKTYFTKEEIVEILTESEIDFSKKYIIIKQ